MDLPEPGTVIRVAGVAGDIDHLYTVLGVDPAPAGRILMSVIAVDGATSGGSEDLRLEPHTFTIIGWHEPIGVGECASRLEWISTVRERALAAIAQST